MQNNTNTISIYIHWPFCLMKCPYCDFNAYIPGVLDQKKWENGYINALNAQLPILKHKTIKSIFFGGGTPSLMDPSLVHNIINHIKKLNNNLPVKEISLEANPSTIEYCKFQEFKLAGVNRISVGVQSFNDSFLKLLGRNHTSKEAICALEIANKIFPEVSFDLMMGLPNQTLPLWKKDINLASKLVKNHLSIYQLTIEEGTKFHKNQVPAAEENLSSEMYLYNIQELEKLNIYQYEISNFARLNHESIHNLNYWYGGQYIGIGPQAHGRIFYKNKWYATTEIKLPMKWLRTALALPLINLNNFIDDNILFQSVEPLSDKQRQEEQFMTYLRLSTKIPKHIFDIVDRNKLEILISEKLIYETNDAYTLTNKAKMCLNHIVYYLLT